MEHDHRTADRPTIDAARSGDREALAQLWRIYQPQVLRMLKAKRADSPDDIASQVWIDVGRGLRRFDGDGRAFQKWIFTIAGRRTVDAARRTTRRLERLETLARETDVVHVDPEPGSLDRALDLISTLPPSMAEAVMLRVVHDLAVDEVAAIMDTSEGHVRVLVHRGLTKLRAATADAPGEPSEPSRRKILEVL